MVEVIKGTDTLQQVTDVGNTTSNDIEIRTNKELRFNSLNDITKYGRIYNADASLGQLKMQIGISGETLNFTADGLGISSSSTSKAILSIASTAKGILIPRMTSAQKNAISSPAEGLEVYDLTLHKKCVYNGSAWETITSL